MELLLQREEILAEEANRLGLVQRVTSRTDHPRDALAIAQALAAEGPARLLALKRALALSATPLENDLRVLGAGFEHLPAG